EYSPFTRQRGEVDFNMPTIEKSHSPEKSIEDSNTVGLRIRRNWDLNLEDKILLNILKDSRKADGHEGKSDTYSQQDYALEARNFYNLLEETSIELHGDECRQNGIFLQFWADVKPEIGKPTFVNKLIEKYLNLIDNIVDDGDTLLEGIFKETESAVDVYDNRIENLKLVVDRINHNEKYFRRHLERTEMTDQGREYLNETIQIGKRVKNMYRLTLEEMNKSYSILTTMRGELQKVIEY
ncbi:MAG: hypothetical protein KKF44_00245, partial [Nanoarchaeota archaeon]|nr:hypothetical protein [Nanoarchaeota archaeon]